MAVSAGNGIPDHKSWEAPSDLGRSGRHHEWYYDWHKWPMTRYNSTRKPLLNYMPDGQYIRFIELYMDKYKYRYFAYKDGIIINKWYDKWTDYYWND